MTWLVTGGSRGIGKAVVDKVAKAGGHVAVLARGPATTPYAVPDLVREIPCDVTSSEDVAAAVARVADELGGPDVVVNCAGAHRGGRVSSLSREAWDEVVATNLTGAFEICRAVVGRLSPGAAIVNVGAVVGFRGFPGDAAYGAAKAGLSGLTQVLAVELAPAQVRVNLVVPGFVETDMTAGLSGPARERILAAIPAGRVGDPEEIADVVVAVAGATYMTGAVVPVDGGLLASFGGLAR
ncbi:SDR family NAD(P)-dependent oxidoreductase [Pseudonocardia benzenivorans]|jgi:3-oxoacyl-[acyl-carrier protein] reductase|uniref:3-oxoacyl-(Acyl-carrier-protein) reductase n=2 Tax=Pseudonocardia TaxID=1847 RepID=F4CXB0_PSEUX|nr:SDR family oxidoreductase [Pseudonocardia dioxanivorans]AEA25551.1 3-oxoacyl-(acyl-carrier-protein) reductase [Pseudonocardia dioxanivorans CB1190]GJF03755.1 3-oxoacyl-[acyl-carrier-protein] reductase FabG [Pseudonocardia sp. D17]